MASEQVSMALLGFNMGAQIMALLDLRLIRPLTANCSPIISQGNAMSQGCQHRTFSSVFSASDENMTSWKDPGASTNTTATPHSALQANVLHINYTRSRCVDHELLSGKIDEQTTPPNWIGVSGINQEYYSDTWHRSPCYTKRRPKTKGGGECLGRMNARYRDDSR